MPIAQLNIAKARAPLDDPLMADFVGNIDAVNALAEAAPGFIWRFADNDEDQNGLRVFGDALIVVNMSVWVSVEALKAFVYKSAHVASFKRKAEWFEKMGRTNNVLWRIPEGHIPTLEEGRDRLELLDQIGDGPDAFGFAKAACYAPEPGRPARPA